MEVSKDSAWLWQSKAFSDVTLLVYPAGDGPDGAWTSGKPEPVARLLLHASVLASVSPEHYRGHLLRLWQDKEQGAPAAQQREQDEPPAAKRAKITDPDAAGKVLELICFPGEPEAVPEAVLHHAYTGILPDEAQLLAWMMWRADYLDMHATVEACLAKLEAMADGGKLTVQDLVVINSLPALQTGSRAAAEQQVAQIAAKVLESQLGVAHRVVGEQQLMDQLVQLPFPLFKQWATLESVLVDSENTVAVLITAWYDHQLSNGTPATEQQCKELSALICLDKVSPSFHMQALPHLKWYRAPEGLPKQHAVARVMAALNAAARARSFQAAMASGGVARQLKADTTHQWSLTHRQLQELWKEKALDLPGGLSYAGYYFRVRLDMIMCKPRLRAVGQQQAAAAAGQQQAPAVGQQQAAGVGQQHRAAADWLQQAAAAAAGQQQAAGVGQQQAAGVGQQQRAAADWLQQAAAAAAGQQQAAGVGQQQAAGVGQQHRAAADWLQQAAAAAAGQQQAAGVGQQQAAGVGQQQRAAADWLQQAQAAAAGQQQAAAVGQQQRAAADWLQQAAAAAAGQQQAAGVGQQQAEAVGQQQAAAMESWKLCLCLDVDWPGILIDHGLDVKVPDPCTALMVTRLLSSTDLVTASDSKMTTLNQSFWDSWDNVTERRFSSFEELASYAGSSTASQPDQATKLEVTITLSNIQ